jgi:hypothetical protein
MPSGELREFFSAACAEVQVINMKVNDVELVSLLEHLLDQVDMVSQRVDAILVEAQSLRADGNQTCIGKGVAAGEKRNIVPLTYQFFGKPGDDALRSSIQSGWYAFVKWRHLGNSHSDLESVIYRTNVPVRRLRPQFGPGEGLLSLAANSACASSRNEPAFKFGYF